MRCFILTAALVFAAALGAAAASEERYAEEYTCLPVNGYINLPGILYDDLTPLARATFNSNPAAVTNALYALPFEEREDFIGLYLEPLAREKHRFFFARCREVADRRAREARVDGGREIIPPALRAELQEREKVRLALHDGAIPFRIGEKIVYIPIPSGYSIKEGPLVALQDVGLADSLAVFEKADVPTEGMIPLVKSRVMATVKHVRQGADKLGTLLSAYQIMVDKDWRLVSIYPPEATVGVAEGVEYKWNLEPFGIRDDSFCYGQFEKTADFHGVEQIRYRATAVVVLPGSYIQVSVLHLANTSLDMVTEMNTDLRGWRDAIMTANGK